MKYTYLITDGKNYKIGSSINPEQRLNALQTANPDLKLICYGNGASENLLHITFAEFRIKREWFGLSGYEVMCAMKLIKRNPDTTTKSKKQSNLNLSADSFAADFNQQTWELMDSYEILKN